MAQKNVSLKHIQINKANAVIVGVTAGACFVIIFSLVASYALFGQLKYQNKVISEKKSALKVAKDDVAAAEQLETSYKAFISTSQNALQGNPKGTGDKDGDNAKLVLDALPSKYDFPALATSLEKVLSAQGVKIGSISGTDDEIAQSQTDTSATPAPIAIPFQVTVNGNYQSIQKVVTAFQSSIRPFHVLTESISGGNNDLTLTLTAETYYQPEKSLNVSTKVVK